MGAMFDEVFAGLVKSVNAIIGLMENVGAKNAIVDVIFNDPATIVVWADGVRTLVLRQKGDVYDKRTGLLLCIAKRSFGNSGLYNDILDKYAPED